MYDQNTIDRLIQGDDDAFSTIYDELSPMVYHRVYDRLQDHAKAREALRNVFLDVYRYSSQLRDATLFDQWIESLVKFYTSPKTTNDARNENPDLQIVWADISETIAAEIKNEEAESTNKETEEMAEQEVAAATHEGDELAWEIQETEEDPYDFTEQVIVYDDSLDTDLFMEQSIEEMSTDTEEMEPEENMESDESMPGVDAEVAKLIEELRTEDWSPILFPPDDVDDMPKSEIELPWMRSIEVENYDFSIDPSVLEVANALISEGASINVSPTLDTTEPTDKSDYEETKDLLGDATVEIVTEIEGGGPLENISLFPSNSTLMDRSNAERTNPPEWLMTGVLPNIDTITASTSSRLVGDAVDMDAKEATIVGSLALKDDKIPLAKEVLEEGREDTEESKDALGQEAEIDLEDVTEMIDEEEIANDAIEEIDTESTATARPIRTFAKGHMKQKKEPKLAAVYYESVNIDVDQVNSRISYERVPYEYVPYEEASQEVYDQFNNEEERRRTKRMERKEDKKIEKERILETEPVNKAVTDFGKVELPKTPAKAAKPKKSFAAAGLFVAVIAVIGGAIYFAKMSGLI